MVGVGMVSLPFCWWCDIKRALPVVYGPADFVRLLPSLSTVCIGKRRYFPFRVFSEDCNPVIEYYCDRHGVTSSTATALTNLSAGCSSVSPK